MCNRFSAAAVGLVLATLPVLAYAQTITLPPGIPAGGFVLQNPTTGALPARGRTTGVGFAKGAAPAGSTFVGSTNGSPVPIQVDVHSTWPDGSARWASVSLIAPALAAGASVPITINTASGLSFSGTSSSGASSSGASSSGASSSGASSSGTSSSGTSSSGTSSSGTSSSGASSSGASSSGASSSDASSSGTYNSAALLANDNVTRHTNDRADCS